LELGNGKEVSEQAILKEKAGLLLDLGQLNEDLRNCVEG